MREGLFVQNTSRTLLPLSPRWEIYNFGESVCFYKIYKSRVQGIGYVAPCMTLLNFFQSTFVRLMSPAIHITDLGSFTIISSSALHNCSMYTQLLLGGLYTEQTTKELELNNQIQHTTTSHVVVSGKFSLNSLLMHKMNTPP